MYVVCTCVSSPRPANKQLGPKLILKFSEIFVINAMVYLYAPKPKESLWLICISNISV